MRQSSALTWTEWKYHGVLEDRLGFPQHEFQQQVAILEGEFPPENVGDADESPSAVRVPDMVELTAFFFEALVLPRAKRKLIKF